MVGAKSAENPMRPPRPPADLVVVYAWFPNPSSASGDMFLEHLMLPCCATSVDIKEKLLQGFRIAGAPCLWLVLEGSPDEIDLAGGAVNVLPPKPIAAGGTYTLVWTGSEDVVSAQVDSSCALVPGEETPLFDAAFQVSLPPNTRRVVVADTSVLRDWIVGGTVPVGDINIVGPDTYVVFSQQVEREIDVQRSREGVRWPAITAMAAAGAHYLPLPGSDPQRMEQAWKLWYERVLAGRECSPGLTEDGRLLRRNFPEKLEQHHTSRRDQNDFFVFLDALLLAHS
eukprot:m51a1_g1929 hypothetical protein (284) ;mRNA; r:891970-893056